MKINTDMMSITTKSSPKDNLKKWVGYKAITINQGDTVRCMSFVDYGSEDKSKENEPDLEKQDWKIYYDVTDDGKLHERFKISNEDDYKNKYGKKRNLSKLIG